MTKVTSPIMLNATGERIAESLEQLVGDTSAAAEAARNLAVLGNFYEGRELAAIPEIADEVAQYDEPWLFLSARIAANNFDGLRVGDWFNVKRTDGSTFRADILAFNHYYNCADQAIGKHIVCGAHDPIPVTESAYVTNGSYIMWNTTATNQGTAAQANPYINSNLHKWELNAFLPTLPTTLQNKLLNHRSLCESRYSASGALEKSTGWAWADLGKVWSPSEMEVYGCPVWGTPGYSVGMDSQFPYFRETKNRIKGRIHWWLRVVSGSSSSNVCYVNNHGNATNISATNTGIRPLPCFLLGA